MAAVGSSVGLGNFWRFPYTAGEEGGGAFIAIYLVCVLLIGLPLLMAEYAMGRKSGMSAIEGIQSLARAESRSQNWGIATWIGTLTAFFISTFYVVISAWLLAFFIQSFGGYAGIDAAASGQNFNDMIGQGEHPLRSKWYILALLACFIGANVFVVGRGVKGGIERASTILMPAFFIMLIVVVIFSMTNGDTARAAAFILEPKWEDVGFKTFLAAIGQAFFSIGVGVGLMVTYGAYLSKDTDIFATVFFALALFAAFTSSISLMEVSVSWLEERQGVTRFGASLGIGFSMFMIGAAYVFSLEYLDFMDFMTEGLLLPLGGLLTATFAGWILSRDMLTSELGEGVVMNVWRFLMRWFVPPFVAIILVFGFMDKIQDQYHVPLPGALTLLLGPNWVPPVE